MSSSELIAAVRSSLVQSRAQSAPLEPGAAIPAAVHAAMPWQSEQMRAEAVESATAEIHGAGPLDPLLADPLVTDVLVNSTRGVWVDRGHGMELTDVSFRDDDSVRRLAVRLAAASGRRLDPSSPFADATLPDGTRVHAAIDPASRSGSLLSLRILRRRALTVPDLAASGSLQPLARELIQRVVAARAAFVITGGTGSGKTTLLAAILGLVDQRERVLILEDSPELAPDHPHVISLITRPPNAEGAGEITMRDLVRQSLRMRPDRLIVGEVRGAEIADLLSALNTGHEGGAATVHANSARELPARLEALGSTSGLTRQALSSQALAALHVVIHVQRERSGRRVAEIGVLVPGPDRMVEVETAVTFVRSPAPGVSIGSGMRQLQEMLDLRGCWSEDMSQLVAP